MTSTTTIAAVVTAALSGKSMEYLQDVAAHGIHNLTNDYSDSAEDYDAYAAEFAAQASELLADMERAANRA